MFLLLKLVTQIACESFRVLVDRNSSFEVSETYLKNDPIYLELEVLEDEPVKLVAVRTADYKEIASYNLSSVIFHAKSQLVSSVKYVISNMNDKPVTIYVNIKDPRRVGEVDTLTPISETKIVSNLRVLLKDTTDTMNKAIDLQDVYENMVRSSKRMVFLLVLLEFGFCILIVIFLHFEIIKLFEKRRKV